MSENITTINPGDIPESAYLRCVAQRIAHRFRDEGNDVLTIDVIYLPDLWKEAWLLFGPEGLDNALEKHDLVLREHNECLIIAEDIYTIEYEIARQEDARYGTDIHVQDFVAQHKEHD